MVCYMKRLFFLLVSLFVIVLSSFAHKINNYKYLYLVEQGNLYGLETTFRDFFTQQGFTVMSSSDVEEMPNDDKTYLLIAQYQCHIVYGASSTLTLTLSNTRGTIVYSTSGQGISFSAQGDMRKASRKVIADVENLKYKFTEPTSSDINAGLSISKLSEDSIRSYLTSGRRSTIEGIYKNISNDGDFYRFAILKENGEYCGVITQTDNAKWNVGDVKIKLSHIENNTYDAIYYDYAHVKQNCIATLSDRILEVTTQLYGKTRVYQYLKVFPTKGDETDSNNTSLNSSANLKGTGSGILISQNVIATNNHVIENASNIEVVLSINGIRESYKARVLCVDKTNDLALLCIKDEKYKNKAMPPFSISKNSKDVGTSVFTMGYPLTTALGEEVKITDGLISSKTGYEGDVVTYQISAAIQPGNSGGALFDKKGNLVGITNAGVRSADNVGYAIKSSYLLNLIDSAPIEIKTNQTEIQMPRELPEIIKTYAPYIAIIKVY